MAVRTDAFIVVFERNLQRIRSNAVYSTSQSGCKRNIRRCTGGAFALSRENPAEQQEWYYEVVKGSVHAKAVRCRACRDRIKAEEDLQRQQVEDADQRASDDDS